MIRCAAITLRHAAIRSDVKMRGAQAYITQDMANIRAGACAKYAAARGAPSFAASYAAGVVARALLLMLRYIAVARRYSADLLPRYAHAAPLRRHAERVKHAHMLMPRATCCRESACLF